MKKVILGLVLVISSNSFALNCKSTTEEKVAFKLNNFGIYSVVKLYEENSEVTLAGELVSNDLFLNPVYKLQDYYGGDYTLKIKYSSSECKYRYCPSNNIGEVSATLQSDKKDVYFKCF